MRVLLVEDEAALALPLQKVLTEAGYAVDWVDNGRDAWALGGSQPFDAVVLDLGLPVMDGLSVLKRWRSEGMSAPVLILTARDQWHDKVTGIDAGADDYLTKPFNLDELQARLLSLLRRSALPAYGPGAARSEVAAQLAAALASLDALQVQLVDTQEQYRTEVERQRADGERRGGVCIHLAQFSGMKPHAGSALNANCSQSSSIHWPGI